MTDNSQNDALGINATRLARIWHDNAADVSSAGELSYAQREIVEACLLGCVHYTPSGDIATELREQLRKSREIASLRSEEDDPHRAFIRADSIHFDEHAWRLCGLALSASSRGLLESLTKNICHPTSFIRMHFLRMAWLSRSFIFNTADWEEDDSEIVWGLLNNIATALIGVEESAALAAGWFDFDSNFYFYAGTHPCLIRCEYKTGDGGKAFFKQYHHRIDDLKRIGMYSLRNRMIRMESYRWSLLAGGPIER